MFKYVRVLTATLLAALICSTGSAQAAAARFGSTTIAIAALTRGNAVAYDSVNKVYLVVGASGIVNGRFVNANGAVVGAPFKIQASSIYTHFPRVAFSPDADGGAGAFLVTWSESDLAREATSLHVRLVSYPKGGPISADTRVGNFPMYESGNGVAYATVSKEFLVVWKNLGTNDVAAARIDNAGNVIAQVGIPATPDGERDPNVAYNPTTDQFLIVYSGYNNAYAFVAARRVQAGTGAVLDADRITLTQTSGTYITDVSYNAKTNQFLAAWYALPAGAMLGRLVNADGTLSGNIITLSSRFKAYDALSLAYNRRSDTFLMSTHGTTAEDAAIEIASGGTPVDNGFTLTGAGGNGNFYPRVAASTDAPNWLASTANNFTSTMIQLVAGTASGDPDTPTTPKDPGTPTTPAAIPNPRMNVDYPAVNSSVAGNSFVVAGWALDQGSTSGTGIDVVQVWAYPVGSTAAQFVGTATYGNARPDVAGYVGAQFTNCGFTLVGSLAPGTYDLYIFGHSTVSGTFNNVKIVRVNVTAPVSNPKMWLDLPAVNQTVSQNITVAGWAVDFGASTGSGVDTVHVWAYPTVGEAMLIGVAQYGTSRPDIAAWGGSSRFGASGFFVTGTLPAGDYKLVAFAHSTVTNTFNNVVVVPIKVR